jgi:Domain of unknown function (DUF4286)
MNIVYEVNIEIDAAIEGAYRAWLAPHIDEILRLPGFTGARVYEVLDPPPSADAVALCVQYLLIDRESLEIYLRDHAPRLRADAVARFGERFRALRRVLREGG